MVFVGEERKRIVSGLVDAFDEVARGGTSRLVTLVSLPGWGKTRIIQEFYAVLAARQSEPHYWPDTLVVSEEGEQGILKARKLTWPEHMEARPDGARPDFMWWGIGCTVNPNNANAPMEVLDQAIEQVVNHSIGRQNLEGLKKEFFGDAIDLSTNALSVLGVVGLLTFPPIAAVATGVGVAKFAWDRQAAWRRGKAALDEHRAKGRTLAAASSKEEADETVLRFLTKWSSELPLVIILDDAHWASPRTLVLVNDLITSNVSRVFVVATTWPHGVSSVDGLEVHDHAFRAQFAEWQNRLADRVSTVTLELLSSADASLLFDSELAEVHENIKTQVLDRVDHNPLVLRLYLRVFGQKIARGRFNVDDVPREVTDAFQLIWKEFPIEVKRFLALAAHLGQHYFIDLLDDLSNEILLVSARELARASASLEWVRSIDELLQSFGELTLYEITVNSNEYRLAEEGHERLRAELERFTSSDEFDALNIRSRMVLLEQQVLLAERFSDLDRERAAQASIALSDLYCENMNYFASLKILEYGLSFVSPSSELDLGIRECVFHSVVGLGRPDIAIEVGQNLLDDLGLMHDSDHPNLFGLRYNLSGQLVDVGRNAEALEGLNRLLDDQSRILGPDNACTLRSRGQMANVIRQLGRPAEALEIQRHLLTDQIRILGPEDHLTLFLRSNIALSLSALKRFADAFEMQQQLLADYSRVFGPDDPETLVLRNNMAVTLMNLDRYPEALEMQQQLLGDRERILGSDHPKTLSLRNNMSNTFIGLGQLEKALETQQLLLMDQIRCLGPEHLETLRLRGNLAITMRSLGRERVALKYQQVLLADQIRILGPEHLETLRLRRNLAITMMEINRGRVALKEQQCLLEDQIRILEADHPMTLELRGEIVVTLGQLSRLQEAHAILVSLLVDLSRIYGPDHPTTLLWSNNLDTVLSDLGISE